MVPSDCTSCVLLVATNSSTVKSTGGEFHGIFVFRFGADTSTVFTSHVTRGGLQYGGGPCRPSTGGSHTPMHRRVRRRAASSMRIRRRAPGSTPPSRTRVVEAVFVDSHRGRVQPRDRAAHRRRLRPEPHGHLHAHVPARGSRVHRRHGRVLVVRARPGRARQPGGEQKVWQTPRLPRGAQGRRQPRGGAVLLPEVARQGGPGDQVLIKGGRKHGRW